VLRIGGAHEGPFDLSLQGRLLHHPANPAFTDPAAAATQIDLHRAISAAGMLDLNGLDGIANLGIL